MTKRNELRQSINDDLEKQVRKQTEALSKEEVVDLYVSQTIKTFGYEQYIRALRNAIFVAKTEKMQGRLFDPNTLEPTKEEEREQEILEELLAAQDITEEYYNQCIQKIQASRNRLIQGAPKKNKKKKESLACRCRQADEEVIIPLEDEICPNCGGKLVHAGYKKKYKVIFKPAQFTLVLEKRETKVCSEKCLINDDKSVVITAEPKEPELLDKSVATESLVAGIAYEKFIMCTPLYRIEKSAKFFNTPLCRETMSNITLECSQRYLAPLCDQMNADLLEQNVVHMDETTLKCLEFKNRSTSYMVCAVSGAHAEKKIVLYRFFESHAAEFITDILGDNFSNAFMTDGLQGYSNYEGCIKLTCMAHARRKLYEAMTCRADYAELKKLLNKDTALTPEAIAFLDKNVTLNTLVTLLRYIGELYRIEEIYGDNLTALKAMREGVGRLVFEKLSKAIEEFHEGSEGGSRINQAAKYFLDRKEELERYLDNPIYPIDDNLCEQHIKYFVMARKNFLFTNSKEGAESAAVYMSLMITAQRNGINPFEYIKHVLGVLKYYKDQPIPQKIIEELVPYSGQLPDNLYIDSNKRGAESCSSEL